MVKKKPFKVKVIIDMDGLPEGSVVEVFRETKTHYLGIWSSANGSYAVKFEKFYGKKILRKKFDIKIKDGKAILSEKCKRNK